MWLRVLTVALVIMSVIAGGFVYKVTRNDFSTITGDNYRWESLEGQWVVINYFAPWCAPCLREMPELHDFDRQSAADTKVFAVNFDVMDKAALQAMVNEHNIALEVIYVEERTVLPMAKPQYLPATYIIGPDGQVVDEIMGEVTSDLLTTRLQQLQSR